MTFMQSVEALKAQGAAAPFRDKENILIHQLIAIVAILDHVASKNGPISS